MRFVAKRCLSVVLSAGIFVVVVSATSRQSAVSGAHAHLGKAQASTLLNTHQPISGDGAFAGAGPGPGPRLPVQGPLLNSRR